jgi:hypothetical protein
VFTIHLACLSVTERGVILSSKLKKKKKSQDRREPREERRKLAPAFSTGILQFHFALDPTSDKAGPAPNLAVSQLYWVNGKHCSFRTLQMPTIVKLLGLSPRPILNYSKPKGHLESKLETHS